MGETLSIWQRMFSSLCDAPLHAVSVNEIDDRHPIKDFLHYWHDLGQGHAPQPEQFNPGEIKALLRWLMVFDSIKDDDTQRFKLRLHGTAAVEIAHGDYTGMYLEEFTAKACFLTRYRFMVQTLARKTPGFGRADLGSQSEYACTVDVGMFPFMNDLTEKLVVVCAPTDPERRRYFD